MRIISGKHRARKITPPPDKAETRPIPDRVKEALFNLLRGHFEDATVIDVFAGTGSIGLETLSRGAKQAVFIERDKRMAAVLQKNIDFLGETDRALVVTADALGPMALARCPSPVKLAFIDPPYPLAWNKAEWSRVLAQAGRIIERMQPDGFLVLRTPWPAIRRDKHNRAGGDDTFDMLGPDDMAADLNPTNRRAPPEDIELDIPGAEGPETHVYRHTAIHLYAPAS